MKERSVVVDFDVNDLNIDVLNVVVGFLVVVVKGLKSKLIGLNSNGFRL